MRTRFHHRHSPFSGDDWLRGGVDRVGTAGLVVVFVFGLWITPIWVVIPAYVLLFVAGLIAEIIHPSGSGKPGRRFPPGRGDRSGP